MKELTSEQIQENWQKLRGIIDDTFEGERLEKLNVMYDYFEDRMVIAPASGKEHYHNAMVGGYVEHILNIVNFSTQIKKMWEDNGAIIDFTDEELIFAALVTLSNFFKKQEFWLKEFRPEFPAFLV